MSFTKPHRKCIYSGVHARFQRMEEVSIAAIGGGVGSVMLNGTSEGEDADYWLAVNYKWLL
ncbi:hypothetical protein HKW98_01410 [Stutzerimonas urumqiensis]|uniref:hypothetical protein n=1 Tax=Stutzerimonas urumqiensis TaxID=638269 RepID=UPI003BAC19B6